MTEGIILENVTFSYNKNNLILNNLSLAIPKGSFLGVTGMNGSGKTTFTYLLNGLIPHVINGHLLGNIWVDKENTRSKNLPYFARKVGMVFQNPDFSLFNLTVEEEISFGITNLQLNSSNLRIKKALDLVGLSGFSKRNPQSLSYGEKQKVNLACVLALETDYIVLDEPTAMLDYKSSLELYQILKSLNNNKKTIIVVEHDTDFLYKFATKMLILADGQAKEFGDPKSIFSQKNLLYKLGVKKPHLTDE